MRWSPGLTGLLAGALAASGCYETTPLRLSVQSPAAVGDCGRVADGVFFDAAYVSMRNISGPDRFYTPRVVTLPLGALAAQPAVGWGIGVWLKSKAAPTDGGRCEFELESLQPGPMCGLQCVYSPQRGEEADQILKDFAHRLSVAAR